MSTLYVADGAVAFEALQQFDADGIRAQAASEEESLVLTDGENCMWAYPATDQWPVAFESCGKNDPTKIVSAVERGLGVQLISEHEDEFENLRRKQ